MKLSKKFKERYGEFTAYYDQECLEIIEQYELQPDDIEGAVILSIEEAKQVKTFLDNAIELHDKGVVVIQSNGFETIHLINERVKQVEGKECRTQKTI